MEGLWSSSELLLPEFDEEMKKTRTMLERVPADKRGFRAASQVDAAGQASASCGPTHRFRPDRLNDAGIRLRDAQLQAYTAGIGSPTGQLLDEGAAKTRNALAGMPDDAWKRHWKLMMHGKTIFEGSRFLAYRQMFLNHIVHHRAQLGVYLRMNEAKVPAIYGPSADERWFLGF